MSTLLTQIRFIQHCFSYFVNICNNTFKHVYIISIRLLLLVFIYFASLTERNLVNIIIIRNIHIHKCIFRLNYPSFGFPLASESLKHTHIVLHQRRNFILFHIPYILKLVKTLHIRFLKISIEKVRTCVGRYTTDYYEDEL